MINGNFKMVFSFEVWHSFFENDTCTCLRFQPGAETRELIRRFGFLVRYKVNGFDIYTDNPNSVADILTYVGKARPAFFDFDIESTNPDFGLFTDLPADWAGEILYDSHKISDVDKKGIVTLEPVFNTGRKVSSLAGITIHFDDIMKFRNERSAAQFRIMFRPRSTQWQYYIINRSNVHFEQPGIVGKQDIHFNGPVNVDTPGGEPALLFTSGEDLIPFTETMLYRFDLVNKKAGEMEQTDFISPMNILFKGLPVPDPARTGKTVVNGRQVVSSPMYVYL